MKLAIPNRQKCLLDRKAIGMSTNVVPFPNTRPRMNGRAVECETAADAAASAAASYVVEATHETTPSIFPHVPHDVYRICNDELVLREFLLVPVHPIVDADPKNYVKNIAREMLDVGGRPVFGYRIRTTPLFVVAEFYAMHKTNTGLVDVTPNARGESYVVFVPDYDIPPDFDYLDRPATRRFSTYEAPTRQQRVAAEIAAMAPRSVASERRVAADLGLTLEDKLSFKLVADAMEVGLDLFFQCCQELETMTMAALDGREVIDVNRLASLQRRRATLEGFVDTAFAEHRANQPSQRRRDR